MNTSKKYIEICGTALLLFISACTSKPTSTAPVPASGSDESYHADNDIAMTVRSLADAIRIGEPLDSADYDFRGVLTDGQGNPLYTDMRGMPGEWQVNVTSPTSAVIRNTVLGDLMPRDLEYYILQSLGLGEDNRTDVSEDPHDDVYRSLYDFDGGYICIETRTGDTDTGQQAALITILTSKAKPI